MGSGFNIVLFEPKAHTQVIERIDYRVSSVAFFRESYVNTKIFTKKPLMISIILNIQVERDFNSLAKEPLNSFNQQSFRVTHTHDQLRRRRGVRSSRSCGDTGAPAAARARVIITFCVVPSASARSASQSAKAV